MEEVDPVDLAYCDLHVVESQNEEVKGLKVSK